MRQTRLSIGCQDWQEIVMNISAQAAGILLYLRVLMRSMQSPEIQTTIPELAKAAGVPENATESALRAIVAAGYLEREDQPDGMIVLRDKKEAAAQADMFRKRAARALARSREMIEAVSSTDSPTGQSGVLTEKGEILSEKQYETDFFMIYSGPSDQKEKAPHTSQKEKSLTEIQTHARSKETCVQAELPADSLEAEFIDVCGTWPPSLRKAVQNEKEDVREAFYLYIRQREAEDNRTWTSDQVRIALLAVKRIPEERRAESILAASMGKWKTIRDAGSGVYFEKETGRVVSLVRGTVEYKPQNETKKTNAELAVTLARNMRRA